MRGETPEELLENAERSLVFWAKICALLVLSVWFLGVIL